MLRITQSKLGDETVLRLEGKLLAKWVEELRQQVAASSVNDILCLDLAQLNFVDRAGHALLIELMARGVRVVASSKYLSQLLHLEAT